MAIRKLDSDCRSQRHFCQRALGRLLSAAREMTPTLPFGSGSRHRTFFRPGFSGLQAYRKEGPMPRQIAARTTLDNLKREAKRWLKALHAGDDPAHARLLRSLPTRPRHSHSSRRSARSRPRARVARLDVLPRHRRSRDGAHRVAAAAARTVRGEHAERDMGRDQSLRGRGACPLRDVTVAQEAGGRS